MEGIGMSITSMYGYTHTHEYIRLVRDGPTCKLFRVMVKNLKAIIDINIPN